VLIWVDGEGKVKPEEKMWVTFLKAGEFPGGTCKCELGGTVEKKGATEGESE